MEEGLIVKLAIGALVPGVVATGVLGAAWWRHRGMTTELAESMGASPIEPNDEPLWIMPALTAVLVAAMVPILTEATSFPPVAAEEWLPIVAISAGVLELITRARSFPAWLRWFLRTFLLACIAAACSRNFLKHSWSVGTGTMWIAGFTTLSLLATRSLELILSRTRGFTAPAFLLIIVGGTSQILAIGYSSLKVGQAVGVVAAVLGAACVVGIVRRRFSLAYGGSFVAITIAAAGLFCCDITANERLVNTGRVLQYTALITGATIVPGLALVWPFSTLNGWKRSLLLFLLAGIPIGIALSLAARDELNRPADGYESLASHVAHYLS